MKIGDIIRRRRKELNMSADELAKKLNKDRSTIYRYENGDIENLPLDILEPIASALDTTPQYLMGWDKNEQIYHAPDDENPHETTMLDAFGKLSIDGQAYVSRMVENFAENGISPAEPQLTEGEKALLELFRQVPEDKQALVLGMIRAALCTDK